MGLAAFYLEDDPGRRSEMRRMSREEARRIAQAFAMLPDQREAMGLRSA